LDKEILTSMVMMSILLRLHIHHLMKTLMMGKEELEEEGI